MKRWVWAGGAALALMACLAPSSGRPAQADEVKQVIKLFNGKDLTNFYTYLGAPEKGKPKYGKNNDPEKVFTVQDGMIRVSGKVFGCFVTEKEYENYRLVVEFKWGPKTWPPRKRERATAAFCCTASARTARRAASGWSRSSAR